MALPEVMPSPGGYDSKKGNGSGGTGFEDYVHSYSNSSYFDKVSACSSAFEDRDVDIEAGSTTPLTVSGRGNGR